MPGTRTEIPLRAAFAGDGHVSAEVKIRAQRARH